MERALPVSIAGRLQSDLSIWTFIQIFFETVLFFVHHAFFRSRTRLSRSLDRTQNRLEHRVHFQLKQLLLTCLREITDGIELLASRAGRTGVATVGAAIIFLRAVSISHLGEHRSIPRISHLGKLRRSKRLSGEHRSDLWPR